MHTWYNMVLHTTKASWTAVIFTIIFVKEIILQIWTSYNLNWKWNLFTTGSPWAINSSGGFYTYSFRHGLISPQSNMCATAVCWRAAVQKTIPCTFRKAKPWITCFHHSFGVAVWNFVVESSSICVCSPGFYQIDCLLTVHQCRRCGLGSGCWWKCRNCCRLSILSAPD